MAKTNFIDIPDELKHLQSKAHEQRDRFYLGVLQGHKREPSKAQKRLLKRASIINSPQEGRGSIFKFLSPYWRTLTPEQKQSWKDASVYSSLNGWQLFISDNAARIRNSISFPVLPSELWQVRAGYIKIDAPASEIVLKQEHPLDYVVAQKIAGKSWKYEIVTIHEPLVLPVTIKIRYKSNLSTVGSNQVARYKITVWTSYQGVDIYTDFAIDFDAVADWNIQEITTSSLRGIIIGYTLYIEIIGYTGTLLFDNLESFHSGNNWARDPRCDNINKEFVKAFAIVPPFWVPVSLPSGSSFSSIFPPVL